LGIGTFSNDRIEPKGRIDFLTAAPGGNPKEFASIEGIVTGSAGANQVDGALVFSTLTGEGPTGTEKMRITHNGNVGIGMTDPQTALHVDGTTTTDVLRITGGSDLAEPFEIAGTGSIEPGMVVAIDPSNPGQLRIADNAYDRTVAGVISGAGGVNPGVVMQQEEMVDSHPVALTGRVYVWADATNGPIQPGDLLTTSDTPGHAMAVTDYEQAHGAILGKAMSSLDEGQELV
ncbi:MAG: hypothetical protein GY794_02935, partial [bacterium]|nr:hypothetical protein [bacterium]